MESRQKACEWVSIEGLKRKARMNRDSCQKIAEVVGLTEMSVKNIMKGKASTTTDFLAKMAAYYRCGVDELIQFPGIEIKERFRTPYFKYYEPRTREVSYEPLRTLFEDVYGDRWRSKMNEFFDKVESPSKSTVSREQKAAQCLKNMGKNSGEEVTVREGLCSKVRTRIRNDMPVTLKLIHNMCKVLGCTPDYIMSYR